MFLFFYVVDDTQKKTTNYYSFVVKLLKDIK
jgi:hypothetical protein